MSPLRSQEVHPAAPPYSYGQADEAFWHRPLEVSSLRRSELRPNQITRPIYGQSVMAWPFQIGIRSANVSDGRGAYGSSADAIWTNSCSQFLYFASGTLAAIYFARKPITKGISKGLLSIAFGVGAWWVIDSLCPIKAQGSAPHALPFVAGYGALAVSCVAILFGFLSLPKYLFPKWLIYLGKISYGLYVFHKLCQFSIPHFGLRGAVLNAAASLVATVACAALSYRFLEKPFLKLKERFA